MEKIAVENLMVPVKEYATVSENATLYEAVKALEKAQEDFNPKDSRHLHRQLLVIDKHGDIIGKIGQLDIIMSLEPKYNNMGDMRYLSRTGFSSHFIKTIMEKNALFEIPLADMCKNAKNLIVKDFMYSPREDEYVEATASLRLAVHMLIVSGHHNLLVTRNNKIVGILRLADVFNEIAKNWCTD